MQSVSGTSSFTPLTLEEKQKQIKENLAKQDIKESDGSQGMLTQADFFALLTKELANQDPTKPVDNNEMISQMTAFSTTDGVQQLNSSFDSFATSMTSSQALQASSLVGRSVLVEDNVFGMAEGETVKGKLVSDKPASNVNIYVENVAGEVIQTVPVGSVAAGGFTFNWDGQTAKGEPAEAGAYRFRIVGLVEGEASELEAQTYRKVDSVTLAGTGGKIVLNLNGGSAMALEDVVEVSEGDI
ncbi:flagellar hook assembly protein FlgD [Colwellia psychrerythraea]|uniref:Basal-body rod modification protein FlgD n=1 Tax=Colwellia psychrerythraea TaxID=28229 RepID=A0A099KKS0_COLPS|nr:flagellar hook assembly protein FlgD [Colwellia psychrerythraea]KGJ91404.1 flagellar hook capping protein [Colwellia psychrerythraea]